MARKLETERALIRGVASILSTEFSSEHRVWPMLQALAERLGMREDVRDRAYVLRGWPHDVPERPL